MTHTDLEIEEVETGWSNSKKFLKTQNGLKKDERDNEITKEWQQTSENA